MLRCGTGDVTLINCGFTSPVGANRVAVRGGAGSLSIVDSDFAGISGTAVMAGAGAVAVEGSSFGSSLLSITGNAIVGGAAALTVTNTNFTAVTGTAVTCGAGDVELQGCEFSSLTGRGVAGSKKLTVTDCMFKDMPSGHGISGGEDVSVSNTLFQKVTGGGNHATAISIGTKLVVQNSSFIECGMGYGWSGYAGGAIGGIGSGKDVTIDNCVFSSNKGPMYGGAIALYQFYGSVTVNNSYFLNNSVSNGNVTNKADGGAIGVYNNSGTNALTLNLNGCTFNGNTALDDAGALFIEGRSTDTANFNTKADINNCTFYQNTGRGTDGFDSGGAVQFSLRVEAVFTHNTFYGNQKNVSFLRGGAIGQHTANEATWGNQIPKVALHNNLFVENDPDNVRRNVYLGGVTAQSGNIGYDNGTAPVAGGAWPTAVQVFGGVPALAGNGSAIVAGCTVGGRCR